MGGAKSKPRIQGGKRNPNPNFLVRIFSSGVGVFHVNGWGPKSSIRPSKPGKSNFFGRDIPGFCRDIPGVPEKFEKKRFVFNFRSVRIALRILPGGGQRGLNLWHDKNLLTPNPSVR